MANDPTASTPLQSLPVAGTTWRLDPAATTVELHTKAMWGMAKVVATFAATEGSGVVAEDGTLTGSLVIDAASVDSGQKKRDQHLRTADFFDVATYPTFVYAATGARVEAGGAITITGNLTAHGVTESLDVRGSVATAGDTVTITGEADLDRSRWGIDWTKMGARLDNHLVVTAVFTRV